jgi:hypothetical protein
MTLPIDSRGRMPVDGSAYISASKLATHSNQADAFASYERITRPFVEANQALASSGGSILLLDHRKSWTVATGLWLLENSPQIAADTPPNRRQVHSSLKLPDYDRLH